MPSIRLDLAAGHYAEIGRMVVNFQRLESTLKHFLLLLIAHQMPEESALTRATLNELSFSGLLRVVSCAAEDVFNPDWFLRIEPESADRRSSLADYENALTQIAVGIKLARSVEARRNQLIHSEYVVIPGLASPPGSIFRRKMGRGSDPGKTTVTAETIQSIGQASEEASRANESLTLGLRAMLNAQIARTSSPAGEGPGG